MAEENCMKMDENEEKAPNWLAELEEKREKRLKRRLGHETGAGAPCLKCLEKCPDGLDLHFWRKICKKCKCAKEMHDVIDEDGWTHLQLFGHAPGKLRKTIVLPIRGELSLDWTPNGTKETIEAYLSVQPTDKLPITGTKAAKSRKLLLKKQLPQHDFDPNLCHDLTDNEQKKMIDYLNKLRNESVGIGQIIQNLQQIQPEKIIEETRYATNITPIKTLIYDNNNLNLLPTLIPNNQLEIPVNNLEPNRCNVGVIRDLEFDINLTTQPAPSIDLKPIQSTQSLPPAGSELNCKRCTKLIPDGVFAIKIKRANEAYYHLECFRCAGCSENLVDLFYFYDRDSDDIYCGRDYAKIRGIPRCNACDELIFVKEYCLADNLTYHLKHFCCFECDQPLAGSNYIIHDLNQQPLCLACYEKNESKSCANCLEIIKPNECGIKLNDKQHYHANNACFNCFICKKGLINQKLLARNSKLYCSRDCFEINQ